MRNIIVVTAMSLFAVAAQAGSEPEYQPDPFGDADFASAPLIAKETHPTHGRFETALLYANSMVDRYNSHMGGMLDLNYHFFDTLGVGVSLGYMHGTLTNLVTAPRGIIGRKLEQCSDPAKGCTVDSVQPNVPDFNQITGIADAMVIWSPLYGKINVVSEWDVNLQLYGLLGMGINGTRKAHIIPDANFSQNYSTEVSGGAFDNTKVHGMVGFGLRVFLTDWLALRGEVRGIAFRDEFVFNKTEGPQGYWSSYWFGQTGLAFSL